MDITEKERWAAMEARLMARLDRLEAVLCRTSGSPSLSPTSSTTTSTPSPPTEAPLCSTVSTIAADASTTTSSTVYSAKPYSSSPAKRSMPGPTKCCGGGRNSDGHGGALAGGFLGGVGDGGDLPGGESYDDSRDRGYDIPWRRSVRLCHGGVRKQAEVQFTPSQMGAAVADEVQLETHGVLVQASSLTHINQLTIGPNCCGEQAVFKVLTVPDGAAPEVSDEMPQLDVLWDEELLHNHGSHVDLLEQLAHEEGLFVDEMRKPIIEPITFDMHKHNSGTSLHLELSVDSLDEFCDERPFGKDTAAQAAQLFQASVVFQGAAHEVFEVLGDQSFVGDKRHWRGCKLPKPPWMVCTEVAESWFEQKLLTDGFLLEASPWCVLSMGLILFSALDILKEVTSKEDYKQLLRIPVWIMSPVPWPILLCTRWELQHRMSWPPDRGEAACIRLVFQPRPCQLIKCSQHVVFMQLKAPWPPPRCMGLALIELDVFLAPWPPPILWGCMVLSFRAYIVLSPTAGTQLELWNIIIGHAHDEGCKKIVQCKSRITTFRAVEMGEQASVHNALEYLLAREGELTIQSGEKYLAGSSWIIVIAQVKCTYHKEKMWFELSDGFIVAHGSESSGARFWLAENSTDVKCRALFHGRIVWQQRDIFQCWAHDLPHSGAVFCRLISVDYGAGLKRVAQNICKTMLDHTSIGDAINCSCITTLLTGQWPWDPGGYDNHPWFHWPMSKEAKNDWLSVHVLERKWATDNEQRGATDACQHVAWGQATFWRGGSVTPGPGDALWASVPPRPSPPWPKPKSAAVQRGPSSFQEGIEQNTRT